MFKTVVNSTLLIAYNIMTFQNETASPHDLTIKFHEVYGHPILTTPRYDITHLIMRAELCFEESEELADAFGIRSLVDMADALGDLVYVCYGAAHAHGLSLNSAFNLPSSQSVALTLWDSLPAEVDAPAVPTLGHVSVEDAIASLLANAEEYLSYVKNTPVGEGDIDKILSHLVFLVSGSYYTSFLLGIPLDDVLQQIQMSNMSKLGEDGNPIYREDGKVLKGSNFFIPEPRIALTLIQAGAVFTSERDIEIEALAQAEGLLPGREDHTSEEENEPESLLKEDSTPAVTELAAETVDAHPDSENADDSENEISAPSESLTPEDAAVSVDEDAEVVDEGTPDNDPSVSVDPASNDDTIVATGTDVESVAIEAEASETAVEEPTVDKFPEVEPDFNSLFEKR